MKVEYSYYCSHCGTQRFVEVDADGYELVKMFKLKIVCPRCTEELESKPQPLKFVNPIDLEIKRLIPPEYLESDTDMFPQAQFEMARYWAPGKKGMLLFGPSGRCKSRIAYWVLEKLVRLGHKAEAYDCRTFRGAVETKIMDGTLFKWYDYLKSVPVLVLDDLGKFKGTGKRIEEELFSLIKLRVEYKQGMIITTNDSVDELADKFSGSIAQPMIRRLAESCEPIAFYDSDDVSGLTELPFVNTNVPDL